MVTAISHILDADIPMIKRTYQESPNTTNIILATLNDYTANVSLQPGEKVVHR